MMAQELTYSLAIENLLGLKISNLNLAPAAKEKKKSSNGGAFEGKGSKQISIGVGLSSYIGCFFERDRLIFAQNSNK